VTSKTLFVQVLHWTAARAIQ